VVRAGGILSLTLAVACGSGSDAPQSTGGARGPSAAVRDGSSAALALRAALEAGDAARSEELLGALAGRLGAEEPCLRARLAFLRDDRGWMRRIEEARAAAPTDPRPYATAAELWAAAGELDAARNELERGVAAAGGLTPELERAKGVLALVQPGGTRVGLECLKRAVARDAALPFVARPFGQAYLLVAKGALADRDPKAALEALEASIAHDPTDLETRELFAQALYANERYAAAIEAYEALLADGRNVRAELATWHKNVGVLAQLADDRADARAHYLRARELGLGEAELATGAHFLRGEARRVLLASATRRVAADTADADALLAEARSLTPDFETVLAECIDTRIADSLQFLAEAYTGDERAHASGLAFIDEALVLDPSDRLARIVRAKLHFAGDDFGAAAGDFRWLLDDARATDIELPEPVHVFLARCIAAEGDTAAAQELLRGYLTREPQGKWVAQTDEYLRELNG